MKNFTNFTKIVELNEAAKRINNEILSVEDINKYLKAVEKKIPTTVANIVYLTIKYSLCDQKSIDDIKNANKGQLDKLAFKYNIPENEIEDIWKNLKELKTHIRLLPQYQTPSERNAFMEGKIKMSDITIDLDSSAGRNACAKMYMPMLNQIVKNYVGTSKLSKPELMSAAGQGFSDAMNDWRKDGTEENSVPFKTYAAFRIKQQIIHDIIELSYTVSTNWYGVKKMGSSVLTAVSIDNDRDEFDGIDTDRLSYLGVEDPNYNLTKSEEENWNELFKLLEGWFKQRDIDIFYRFMGLKGYNKEKGKDIAKSLGISQQLVTGVVAAILRKLKSNPKAMDILKDIQTSYNESLMLNILHLNKDMMIEAILEDNMFILLEELTRWSNKDIYINTITTAIESLDNSKDIKSIKLLLQNDFTYLDKEFKSCKKAIIKFLSLVYPTESFVRTSDVSLLEYMDELSQLYKKYFK